MFDTNLKMHMGLHSGLSIVMIMLKSIQVLWLTITKVFIVVNVKTFLIFKIVGIEEKTDLY